MNRTVGAIVLAAGLSSRMGTNKLLLPWGKTCVIETVVNTLVESGVSKLWVVRGFMKEALEKALTKYDVIYVDNPAYENGEMLESVISGFTAVGNDVSGLILALGDQPLIQASTVKAIIRDYITNDSSRLIIPSYNFHKGHPWLVDHIYWQEIINLKHPLTLNDFLIGRKNDICYLSVNDPGILKDIDTQSDYLSAKSST